jgi:hypothetical protein
LLPTCILHPGLCTSCNRNGSIVLPYTYSTIDCRLLRHVHLIISLPVPV